MPADIYGRGLEMLVIGGLVMVWLIQFCLGEDYVRCRMDLKDDRLSPIIFAHRECCIPDLT